MDENDDIETEATEATRKEAFLELDPGARFGSGSFPGTPVRRIVLVSSAASPLDIRVMRTLAAELRYEMHHETSAIAALGRARGGSWFTPEVVLVPLRSSAESDAQVAVNERLGTLAA